MDSPSATINQRREKQLEKLNHHNPLERLCFLLFFVQWPFDRKYKPRHNRLSSSAEMTFHIFHGYQHVRKKGAQ